jgi:hypothetical protein
MSVLQMFHYKNVMTLEKCDDKNITVHRTLVRTSCMCFIFTTPNNIIIQKFHLPPNLNTETDYTSHCTRVFAVTSCQLCSQNEYKRQSRQTSFGPCTHISNGIVLFVLIYFTNSCYFFSNHMKLKSLVRKIFAKIVPSYM